MIQKLFDAGLWLGVLLFFQPKSILFLILIYTAVLVYNRITIQTILIPLTGLFVPLFLGTTYFFYVDKPIALFHVFSKIHFHVAYFKTIENGWFIPFVLLLSSLAFLLKTPKAMAVSNTFRKSWVLININFFIALAIGLISNESDQLPIVFLLFPAAIVVANGLELILKKTIQSVIFAIIIVCVVFGKFYF